MVYAEPNRGYRLRKLSWFGLDDGGDLTHCWSFSLLKLLTDDTARQARLSNERLPGSRDVTQPTRVDRPGWRSRGFDEALPLGDIVLASILVPRPKPTPYFHHN